MTQNNNANDCSSTQLNQSNNEYYATRVSADNLPFMPTSMTFDSNGELWLADNSASSDVVIMDIVSGGWMYKYGANSGTGITYSNINDFATFKVYTEDNNDTDTDGDGVIDKDDAYPDEDDKCCESYTPSKYGKGTIAFEDLWPSNGDYDFNDVVLNYKAVTISNADNKVVQVDFICEVKSNSAGYTNGIGIQIDNLTSSQIESVTGAVYTENNITLNPNGTEANQDKAVIILTDN